MSANPWNLTPAQAKALDAIAEHGCQKVAADRLGISPRTLETHLHAAKAKTKAKNRVAMVLTWDRWKRGQGVAA